MYDLTASSTAGQAAGALGSSVVAGAAAKSTGLATTGSSIAALVIMAVVLLALGCALVNRSRARRVPVWGIDPE